MSIPGHHALHHRRMQRKRVALDDELVQRSSFVLRAPPGDILGGDTTSSNNAVPTRSSAAPTDNHGSPTTAQTSSSQQSSPTSSATRPTTSSTPTSTKSGDDTPTGIIINLGTSSTSSSTGTSTSTSSSSSSTSTSLTSTVVTSTGINGPVIVTTVRGPHTSFVTPTVSSTATPSATNTAAPVDEGSSINLGGIIGGVVAALLGVAILSAIIRWLSRRSKRRDNDNSDNFDPNEFRRSGVMLNDAPVHSEPIDRGYNPRPPTMIERRFPGAPGPSFGGQYGGGSGPPGQMYGDPTGMQSHYPSYPPQAQIMNVAQPSYPDPNSYASPISLAPAALPPRAPSALDNPYDHPASFDGHAQVSSNPYMAPQAAFTGSEFAVRQSIDYVTLNRSGPPTPVTASPFESPSFFAPVAADAEPLYAASQSKSRQNSLEPPTALAAVAATEMPTRASSDFHGRPSEDYAHAAAMTLPVKKNSADTYGVPAAQRQNTFPQDPTRPDMVYAL